MSENMSPDEGMVCSADDGAGGTGLGNYDFADSVANDLRATAREGAIDDLTESVEGGIYSPQSLYTADRFTADQLVDFAEEGVPPEVEFSHLESLAGSPQVGANSELGVLTDAQDHFFGQHGGNYANDPSEFANPDWETDTLADETFGEGSNLRVVDETQDLGLTSEEPTDPDSELSTADEFETDPEPFVDIEEFGLPSEEGLTAETPEGLELVDVLEGAGEGGEIAAEAAGGLELADVLEIGALLLL